VQADSDLVLRLPRLEGALEALPRACAVHVAQSFDAATCARWCEGVYAAKDEWTHDFDGEQFSLGRAFYTHLEEGRSKAYFEDVAASDARVEKHVPGLQAAMRDLVARATGARVVARRGWCGPGVHVFPPAAPVAQRGGVVHFDTEGLAARHVAAQRPAITVVAMLQTPENADEGGLKVWDVLYTGEDEATGEELARPSALVTYALGDVVLIDSYRLHQIQPFTGARERISATVHAAQVDAGLWETWF